MPAAGCEMPGTGRAPPADGRGTDCCIGGRAILCARELFIGAGCEFIGVGLCETGGGFGAGCDGKEL